MEPELRRNISHQPITGAAQDRIWLQCSARFKSGIEKLPDLFEAA
jgi:hypothetical protein